MPEERYVFNASRWTQGDFFFPVRIRITWEQVIRVNPHLMS
ncbi:MAG: hypothetical protein ACYDA9_17465 [Terriglobia bacterium]